MFDRCRRGGFVVRDAVPIVRPELLALQLFASMPELRAERLVERMWSLRLLSGPSIACCLADLGEHGRNGTAALRRYLDARGDVYVPAATGLETWVLQVLREAGISMRRQVDSGGETWTGRVDFRHPVLPLVLEVQSELHHSALVDRVSDAARIKALVDAGFEVVEVTDDVAWSRPAELVAVVTAAIDRLR